VTRTVLRALCLAIVAAPASAQQTPADVISFLVTNQSVQTGDFQKDQAAAAATRDTIVRALQVTLATVPIASSSSGFAYRLDPELGTQARVSNSFGTFFVERAATSGPGRVSFGVSGTAASYDRLDGANLRDGTLVTTANRFGDESAPFDTEALTLKNPKHNTLMPWTVFARMSREDLSAIYAYLRTVKPSSEKIKSFED